MDSTGGGSFLRNRRFDSFFNTSSDSSNVKEPPKVTVKKKEEVGFRPRTANEYVDDDDGWFCTLISCLRIVTCFVTMMITTLIWALIMVLLLPWPYERIRQGNVYGHVTGRLLIIWYPLFGQLYILAKHIRIDRSNPTAAIQSMKEAAQAIVKNNLSLIIFPEGTRSQNGRLLPFKKGFVHLALQSRLPIVPIVLTGTHQAWRKGSLHVHPTPINVKYLPSISTNDWTADNIDDYTKMVHGIYVKNLPEPQKPLL
ncbi:hypothetical protein Dsin_023058 [Dipteronia sinensis]|uniref:Phospholipid/glycerol acyltransferase domain-containing protein n=1 Tax=Dipteronia sinensis TaxID=43782 RepID=A0AAE0E0D9_9ROSI|nr:hypothetical protein Dsin_023058 [Dipteronia sinensis]